MLSKHENDTIKIVSLDETKVEALVRLQGELGRREFLETPTPYLFATAPRTLPYS